MLSQLLIKITIVCGLLGIIAPVPTSGRPNKEKPDDKVPQAIPINTPRMVVPKKAIKDCISAEVEIEMHLNRDGVPSLVKVTSCTVKGYGLEAAAEERVRKSFFLPLSYYGGGQFEGKARFTVKYRCYDGLIALNLHSSDLQQLDSTLQPPSTLIDELRKEAGNSTTITAVPIDTADTRIRLTEGDVYVRYTYRAASGVDSAWILHSTFRSGDTHFDSLALAIVHDCQYPPQQIPPKNLPDSHLVKISFRHALAEEIQPPESSTDDVQPEMIYQEMPTYSREAKLRRLQGTVWVKAEVDTLGHVSNAKISKSSGSPELDSAAVAAAYHYRYNPAVQGGRKVKVWVSYQVNFKLN